MCMRGRANLAITLPMRDMKLHFFLTTIFSASFGLCTRSDMLGRNPSCSPEPSPSTSPTESREPAKQKVRHIARSTFASVLPSRTYVCHMYLFVASVPRPCRWLSREFRALCVDCSFYLICASLMFARTLGVPRRWCAQRG